MSQSLSKRRRQKRSAARKTWIYIRYIFPIFAYIATAVWAGISCFRYTVAGKTNTPISLYELMSNTWYNVRQYLFGGGDSSAATETFSWVVLALLVGFVLLFLLGFAMSILSAVGAFSYFNNPKDRSNFRIAYLTLLPNRVAACIYELLMLPILLFPRILILCYEKIIHTQVLLNLTFVEPLVIGGVLCGLILILTALTAQWEKKERMNPHDCPRPAVKTEDDEEDGQSSSLSAKPQFENEADRIAYEMAEKSRAEQAERIRRLLNKDTEEAPSDHNEGNKK